MGSNTSDENLPQLLKIHSDMSEGIVLDMRVAGTTFIEDSREFLYALKSVPQENISLTFKREPTNEYDENAVRVSVKVKGYDKPKFIGYIPKEYSELISYVIENSDTYKLLLTPPILCGGVEGKENIGVFFRIKIERRRGSLNGKE